MYLIFAMYSIVKSLHLLDKHETALKLSKVSFKASYLIIYMYMYVHAHVGTLNCMCTKLLVTIACLDNILRTSVCSHYTCHYT